MATAIFRLLTAFFPSCQELEYIYFAPNICALQRSLESVFHSTWYYGSFVSVLFRSAKVHFFVIVLCLDLC